MTNRSLTLVPIQVGQYKEIQDLDMSNNMLSSIPFDALAPTIQVRVSTTTSYTFRY